MAEKKDPVQKLTTEHGRELLRLARRTILKSFGADRSASPDDEFSNEVFQEKRGVFVTIHLDRQLRGCIGNLSGTETIVDGVRRNAVNAAFNDHRFSPLTLEELAKVDLEISILTEAIILAYEDGEDLIRKLRPGTDGVIINQGGRGATFLPQVWDQLPEPENFLSHLCLKAGLSGDAWRSGNLEVKTYQVQYFAEKE
ncbi:MAG: AmmeMemoRadiSam system protein A [Proteobacteria bacterium]|nr:AmmeMemoRadiSam system protein A [Pseudomonadota bacterium]MBU1714855.1 AmmeMemoRadiSam system protein A [Pseudomonadota bacterium]